MTESKRDLRKPISYCCEQMEAELSRGDIIDYIWDTRGWYYILRSSSSRVSHANFCPWCGKDLGKFPLHDEYSDAYDRATEEDSTMRKQSDS
jgi:hypothetical protein